MTGKRILLIIGGGIAAYKCLDLIRRLRERGYGVRAVMTRSAQEFITPLSVGAITGERVFTGLLDRAEEHDVGHIRLSREADLLVVAPATADLMARMAAGLADDLATAVLLATDKPVLVAPAMNPRMWFHPATRRNVSRLLEDGVSLVGPNTGEMAERNETGPGRMAEPLEILEAVERLLAGSAAGRGPLARCRVLVTSGPTHEPVDPVRYIANRSSGKQGHAIAAAAADLGAVVTLVTGPVHVEDPPRVRVVRVETALEMLAAAEAALPADIGVFAAAVADWRVAKVAGQKVKKEGGAPAPLLELVVNPDILRTIATRGADRPALVIGFAAETENVIEAARRKREAKGCDWIVANDVSPAGGVMGGDRNAIHLITAQGVESWPAMDKIEVARRLIKRAAQHLAGREVEV